VIGFGFQSIHSRQKSFLVSKSKYRAGDLLRLHVRNSVSGVVATRQKNRTGEFEVLPGTEGRARAKCHILLGAKAPAKIQEVTLMRPIHGNL